MARVQLLVVAAVACVLALRCRAAAGQLPQLPQLPQLLDCPPENPFCPVWVPCNFTEVQGPTCGDCHTRVVCTPVGGLVRPCLLFRPHCVEGRCSSAPSEQCAANSPPTPPPPPTDTTDPTATTADPDSQ